MKRSPHPLRPLADAHELLVQADGGAFVWYHAGKDWCRRALNVLESIDAELVSDKLRDRFNEALDLARKADAIIGNGPSLWAAIHNARKAVHALHVAQFGPWE